MLAFLNDATLGEKLMMNEAKKNLATDQELNELYSLLMEKRRGLMSETDRKLLSSPLAFRFIQLMFDLVENAKQLLRQREVILLGLAIAKEAKSEFLTGYFKHELERQPELLDIDKPPCINRESLLIDYGRAFVKEAGNVRLDRSQFSFEDITLLGSVAAVIYMYVTLSRTL